MRQNELQKMSKPTTRRTVTIPPRHRTRTASRHSARFFSITGGLSIVAAFLAGRRASSPLLRFVERPQRGTVEKRERHQDPTRNPHSNNVLVTPHSGSRDKDEDESWCVRIDAPKCGRHLSLDVRDADVPRDERWLSEMTILVARDAGLDLSWHDCGGFASHSAMRCSGVSPGGRVSLHAWPEGGAISVDISWGSADANPGGAVPPVLPGRFGGTTSFHSYRLRGCGYDRRDLFGSGVTLGRMGGFVTEEVASVQTNHHRVELYRADRNDVTSGTHPSDRLVYIDGDLRFSDRGKAAYHEALVHPTMLAYFNPRFVAIIGDATGSTLREVLKHKSVEKVKLIVVDEMMLRFYQKYMPEWSDCSDIAKSEPSCFDDSRVEIIFEGALEWFVNHFVDGGEGSFDIIIMDVIDPRQNAEIGDGMYREYKNKRLMEALHYALSEDGVISWHLGPSPRPKDLAEEYTEGKNRVSFLTSELESLAMEGIFVYEEAHTGLPSPSSFLVSCKSDLCSVNWSANPAEVDVMLQYRTHSSVRNVDGSTFASYRIPHRVYQNLYCESRRPAPPACQHVYGLPRIRNTPLTAYEMRSSGVGENAGRGVFATRDIEEGSLLGYEYSASAIHASALTYAFIRHVLNSDYIGSREILPVQSYLVAYGFETGDFEDDYSEYYVDSSINTFVNHGCNGTSNTGSFPHFSCVGVPKCEEYWKDISLHYCPARLRHIASMTSLVVFAERDIKMGEEILQDYTEFAVSDSEDEFLAGMCAGTTLGEVSEYESSTLLSSTE